MSKTLLDQIKDKEVTQVVSERWGVAISVSIIDNPYFPICATFADAYTCTFTENGQVFADKKTKSDIVAYNAPESVQEIKMPSKSKMPEPDAIPPQPTIDEFAEWVTNDDKAKIAILSGIGGTGLIELFKKSRNEPSNKRTCNKP